MNEAISSLIVSLLTHFTSLYLTLSVGGAAAAAWLLLIVVYSRTIACGRRKRSLIFHIDCVLSESKYF